MMKKQLKEQVEEELKVFADYVRREGLRMTRQRELIVRTFLEAEGHVSTDELYELTRKKDENIGYATVFRTLKALTDCGLARETDLDDGRTRFEHLYRRPRHHHIVCIECNHTIEFFSPELEQLQEEIVAQYDFQAVRNKFQIFGICRDCQAQQETEREVVNADLVFARDALRIAMETEQRGVNFYKTAAETVAHDSTRKTFLAMLEDEKSHLEGLQEEWDRLIKGNKKVLNAPVFLHFDYDALKEIFPSREEVKRKLHENLTEEEAFKLAMKMEKEAHNFFREYAERFNDTRGRDVFLRFAEEEEEHYSLIKEAYDALLDDNVEEPR